MSLVAKDIIITPTLTVDHVRRFLQDYPNLNIITGEVQFTQAEINQAMEMVTSRYNSMTPQTLLLPEQWPPHMQYPMLQAITAYLMRSASFLQLRNQVTYQDGDIAPIGVDDKFPLYAQLARELEDSAMQTLQQIKIQNNLNGMYGSLSSGYAYTGRRG